jgi:hypothetical protein
MHTYATLSLKHLLLKLFLLIRNLESNMHIAMYTPKTELDRQVCQDKTYNTIFNILAAHPHYPSIVSLSPYLSTDNCIDLFASVLFPFKHVHNGIYKLSLQHPLLKRFHVIIYAPFPRTKTHVHAHSPQSNVYAKLSLKHLLLKMHTYATLSLKHPLPKRSCYH